MVMKKDSVVKEKNLLVIYLDFPEEPAISFPAIILKYLVRLGWSVTVVVIQPGEQPKTLLEDWSGVQILRITPRLNLFSSLLRRLYSKRSRDIEVLHLAAAKKGEQLKASIPYNFFGIFRAAANTMLNIFGYYHYFRNDVRRTLMKVHAQRPFSAVLSVYWGPFTSHLVARQFAREYHIPWVAFVKDYWSDKEGPSGIVSPVLRTFESLWYAFKRRVEARVLRDADIILSHCKPVADYLRKLVPEAKMEVLPNCYDEEDFTEDLQLKEPANDGIFTALCLGSLGVHQRHDMLFDALRNLCTDNAVDSGNFRVRFVGPATDLIRSYAEAYSCSDIVDSVPRVSHKEAMSFLKQATCLLFPSMPNALGRRTPEYMATRKPILVFPSDNNGVIRNIMEEYGAAFVARDSQEIATTLIEWYRAFKAGRSISGPVQEGLVQSFKASKRALELQEVLIHVLRNKKKTRR